MISPKEEFVKAEPTPHGGLAREEIETLNIDPAEVIDFSVNINPFGPPLSVQAAIAKARIDEYPDPFAFPVKKRISEREERAMEEILIGNGASQIIRALAVSYLREGDITIVVAPTFGEYEMASRLMGAEVLRFSTFTEDKFELDEDRLVESIAKANPRMVWICNPNNPTGSYIHPETLIRLHESFPEALFIVDEAYAKFYPGFEPPPEMDRLVRIKSLTKEYTVPGVRLGYAIAKADIIAAVQKAIPPWSVNAFAVEVGISLLSEETFLEESIPALLAESSRLKKAISSIGWKVLPSPMHYFLVRVGDAFSFKRKMLLRWKILLRDCTSFNLPEYVRISTRLPGENNLLVKAMEVMWDER